MRLFRDLALAALLTLDLAAPAAADNFTVKDATGTTQYLCGKVVASVTPNYIIPCHTLTDASGNAVGTAQNPMVMQLISGASVAVSSLPSLPAGGNAIGSVVVTAMPALAAGTNVIGDLRNITGTITLPTNASTSALQTTGNGYLSTLATASAAQATAANQALMNAALGTPGDAAYNGSNTATLPALLKAIYAQAVPTSLPGISLSATTQTAGIQGVKGGVAMPADTVVQATSTDVGGTITTAGTAQQFMAANSARRGWIFQNQSSGALYVNCLTSATADYHSLLIAAGATYSTDPHHVGTGACSVIGATAGQAFYGRQF